MRKKQNSHKLFHSTQEVRQQKLRQMKINSIKELKTIYTQKFREINPINILHLHQNLNNYDIDLIPKPRLKFDSQYENRCQKVAQQIQINLRVFSKIHAQNHRKKTIMSKLYGWDHEFSDAFFYNEQFRSDITALTLIKRLGLDKRNFQTKNTYNKLRLFLGELTTYNEKQQQLQCTFQKIRLTQSLYQVKAKIYSSLKICKVLQIILQNMIFRDSKNTSIHKYMQQMHRTHLQIGNMKNRIHNKKQDLQELQHRTGKVNIHKFILKDEENVRTIENFMHLQNK